jgi:hypothetical protein
MMVIAIFSSVMYGYFAVFRDDVEHGCADGSLVYFKLDRDLTSDERKDCSYMTYLKAWKDNQI